MSACAKEYDINRSILNLNYVMEKIKAAEIGSDEAFDLMGNAFSIITDFSKRHIDKSIGQICEVNEENVDQFRSKCVIALRPMLFCHGFYGQLADEIIRGVWSLDAGYTPPIFRPRKRPGRRHEIRILELTLRLVSLAHLVKRIVKKNVSYQAELRACGINETSIRQYEKQLGAMGMDLISDPLRAEAMLQSPFSRRMDEKQKLNAARSEMKAIKRAIDRSLKNRD